MTVIETTGGSTGSALAFLFAIKGYRFEAITSSIFAAKKLKKMRAFGAKLHLVESPSGGHDASLFPSMRRLAEQLNERDDYYFSDQFKNPDAIKGYQEWGQELLRQIPGGIDAFCGAVGSAGILMGVSRVLRQHLPDVKVVALEPKSSPILAATQDPMG